MPRHLSAPVFAVVLAVMLALTSLTPAAQSFKWWQHDRYKQELALSPDQVARLEEIFQAAGPAMRASKATFDRLQAELSAMVRDGRADDTTASELIAQVEGARGELGKARGLMLYRMRRILTSDQHAKLQVLFDEYERSKRGHTTPKPQP